MFRNQNQMPNVVIILAQCRRNRQYYGIRFEEQSPRYWVADWAFPLRETVAKHEGYDSIEVKGTIELSNEYPGCPHCQSVSIAQCSCQKIACWDGKTRRVTCPHCGQTNTLGGRITEFDKGIEY